MFKSFSKFSFFAAALTLLPTCINAYPNPTTLVASPNGGSPTLCKKGSTYFRFSESSLEALEFRCTPLRMLGVVFPDGAPWTAPYTGGDTLKLWAPDCRVVDGAIRVRSSTLRIFFCSAIFYAYSTTGASGSWTNGGLVVKTTTSDNYNVSFSNVRLNPTTYTPLSTTYDSLAARAQPQENADSEEAPDIFSFRACGAYNGGYVGLLRRVMVIGGGVILPPHDSVLGPGGQDIFLDSDGTVYMVYHYKTGSSGNLAFHIGLNKLDMSSGWPVVV
ncbi:hypothetical protein R3P38DRAFT_2858032 [Favolaschia claudopus]|uniref:Uncharacterized protein n=1 Tax=Favolaschia claudopus TaxID=2862362 RepID=A0AAW0DGN2_9AGAR